MTDHRHLTEEERQGAADGTLDADRQRVVLWNSWDGRKPAAEGST